MLIWNWLPQFSSAVNTMIRHIDNFISLDDRGTLAKKADSERKELKELSICAIYVRISSILTWKEKCVPLQLSATEGSCVELKEG